MAFALLRHAIRLVLTNWRDALKISAVLYLMQAGFGAVVALGVHPTAGDPGASFVIIAAAIIQGIINIWIAVAWHRFVLLDETPNNYVPMFNASRVLGYLGGSLLIGLVAAGVALVGLVVIGIFAVIHATIIAIPLAIVLMLVLIPIGYRLGMVLPAASVDHRLSLREAWAATRGTTWLILRLALIIVVAVLVLDSPVFLVGGIRNPNIAVEIWLTIVSWFILLVGVALLTTMYGYYIEHRPIRGMPMPPGAVPPAAPTPAV